MKCACGNEKCESRIEWDTGSHSFTATWGHAPGLLDREVLLFYDANALVVLIKEAKRALMELATEVSNESL